MPVPVHEQAKIDKFFSEIAPFEAAYHHTSFRFIALRHKGEWRLSQGVVAFDLAPHKLLPPFETDDIYACELSLSKMALSPREFLQRLLSGGIEFADRILKFPTDHSGNHSAVLFTFDGGRYSQDRAGQLILNGSNAHYYIPNEPEIVRQLKTSEAAFQSIQELAAHFHLSFDNSMNLHVDLLAPRIAEITDNSYLAHGKARIELHLSGALDHKQIRLALRGISYDGQEQSIAVPPMPWKRDSIQNWSCVLDVLFPDGKSVACTVSYGGFVQQQRVLAEPISLRDSLRFIFGQWDPTSKVFSQVIEKNEIKGRDGRDLEDSVAAMLSLAGFRVIAADRLPDLGEVAPDVIAADTRGNLLIVECTLKLPKADDKIGKLFRRYKSICEGLDRAGWDRIQTLAVLAVALPRGDIVPYVEEARKAGIFLWGREDLHRLRQLAEAETADAIFDCINAERGIQAYS